MSSNIKIFFTKAFYKPKPGGVESYIRLLLKNFNYQKFFVQSDKIHLFINTIPKERSRFEIFLYRFYLFLQMIKFPILLKRHNIHIVHSNPSMMSRALIREAVFIFISYLFKQKILIFIHGWDPVLVKKIKNNYLLKGLIIWIFNRAHIIIVLANEFKDTLKNMGIRTAIKVETTMVDDALLDGLTIKKIKKRNLDTDSVNILFLSRIEEYKGIFRTIDAFEILQKKHKNITLNIAGDGSELSKAKEYVLTKKLKHIDFLGYIENETKKNVFAESNIFLLPTTHGEGLPISLLEAICCGLPVVTTPVGGIKDFFENERHGFLLKSTSSSEIVKLMDKLISDVKLRIRISEYNHFYGKKRFLGSVATKRIEKIYFQLFSGIQNH